MLLSYRLSVLLMLIFEILAIIYMAKIFNYSKTLLCQIILVFFGLHSFISGTYAGIRFSTLGSYCAIFFNSRILGG
jgi:hypothetical protein